MPSSHYVLPNIDPIAISIGPLDIRWYGLMYLVGLLFATWLANKQCDRSDGRWEREQASDLLFLGCLGVILGGRIGYVLFYHFSFFLDNPLYLFKIWEGGMSFHGGVLGVGAAMFYYAKKNRRSPLAVADFVVPIS